MRADSKVTRERILSAALKLLNERGVGKVTVRDVARRAKMSHGNLCYHFVNMGALVDTLYDQLVAESDESARSAPALEPSIRILHELQAETFELMLKYRFLFLDFAPVFRERKALAVRLRALKRRRARDFAAFAAWGAKKGLLRRERYRGERELLFRQYDLMSDFWIAQAEIVHRGQVRGAMADYQRVVFAVLIPHLSRRGLAECRALGLLD